MLSSPAIMLSEIKQAQAVSLEINTTATPHRPPIVRGRARAAMYAGASPDAAPPWWQVLHNYSRVGAPPAGIETVC